ncbi:hypothetical protein [Chengkuizengella axinellae]|uniref:Uncharacterized protein n=1 Tax=Chengkuizengella axinellae TaxID=3064388 RepID=A0ABT9IZX8_9BACL|nr:hypothetical protein [Chengkuizengella sp. 2205SS18-9]MDP5274929.1 hypothetical protein [Chengkuizengella sp. 2205SS18-9]
MKKRRFVILIIVVIIFIYFLIGYRLTALGAAKNHTFLSNDAVLMEDYELGSFSIFLFKSDDEEMYRTVLVEKAGLLFRSTNSTYIPYNSDILQTVGGMSFTLKNEEATFLSIVSNDEEIAYIEAGAESYTERKEISMGERISFLFPFSKQINFLNPIAFDKYGNELYYYGYPKNTNVFKNEDLKWHKMK